MSDTLTTIRETIMGEMRHRVVRRKRDGTYWYVAEHRGDRPDKWLPMTVHNQSGMEQAAHKLWYQQTN